jgi:predicted nucleotidyltransferase
MAKKKSLNKTEQKKIHAFIVLVKQQGIHVSQVVLFGSHAKGGHTADSDIDLAVISPQFGRDVIHEMTLLRKLALQIDSHLEPLPLSAEGFNDRYSVLSDEIRRYGLVVG